MENENLNTPTNNPIETPVQQQPQPMASLLMSQRGFFPLIFGVLVLLVVIAGGAYYLGTQNNRSDSQLQNTNNQPTTNSQNETVTNPAVVPSTANPQFSETTNWKTYTSTKANYSFKYPTEWSLINVPPSQGCDVCVEQIDFTPKYNPNSGDATISVILIFREDRIKTLDDYVNIHVKGDSSIVNLKYTTIGGEKAVSYTLSGGIPPLPVIEYVVVKNGMYYIIRLDDSIETNKDKEQNLALFNEMLSTFSFTN